MLSLTNCVDDPASINTFFAVGGRVSDNNGNPIENVKINIDNLETYTDQEGYYTIELTSTGTFILTAERTGFAILSQEISVENGKLCKADLILKKEAVITGGMIFVPGGTFIMGSSGWYLNEEPAHYVTLNDFYLSKYEVTQKDYVSIMNTNPSSNKESIYHPVEGVTWYDAVTFCNKLSEMEGYDNFYNINGSNVTINSGANGYCLPTEAEWEFAASGGNNSNGYLYSGSDYYEDVAWYEGNSGGYTQPVGELYSNELGFFDMSGNVYEWCYDWYDSTYYAYSGENNPMGPSSGYYKIIRGGSCFSQLYYDGFYTYLIACRPAYRNYALPANQYTNVGFRIVRSN
jgi:formylglycine-generating enzyme required for sulfatase activity